MVLLNVLLYEHVQPAFPSLGDEANTLFLLNRVLDESAVVVFVILRIPQAHSSSRVDTLPLIGRYSSVSVPSTWACSINRSLDTFSA